jgi:hypothetical protein
MTVRKLRIFCWTIAAACGFAGAVVLALTLLAPIDHANGREFDSAPAMSKSVKHPNQALTMADFDPLMTGRLRPAPPPAPPPPPVVPVVEHAVVPPPPATPAVQLLGTVVEAGNSYAIFQTADGVEVKKRGDIVGGAKIEDISDGIAVLKRGEETTRLQVPPPAGG